MESRYVYANIRLPILVDSEENLEPLSQYLTIDFDVCHQLPEKPEQGMDHSAIIEKLRELLNQQTIKSAPRLAEDLPSSGSMTDKDLNADLEGRFQNFSGLEQPAILQKDTPMEESADSIVQDEQFQEETPQTIEINKKWFIAIDEIKKNKKTLKHNYSAKHRQSRAKNLTMRSREEIQSNIEDTITSALDTAFGSSLLQEVPEQAQDYFASFE